MKIYSAYQTTQGDRYLYRVEPKGNIQSVLSSGLWTYHPSEMPGSYVDDPDVNTWPDQEQGSYRIYFAKNQWELTTDRVRLRVPYEKLSDRIEKDYLGDYFIDSGDSSECIVTPQDFDIDIGSNQWVRGDMAKTFLKDQSRLWDRMYHQSPGHYKNKYREDGENMVEQPEENEVMASRLIVAENGTKNVNGPTFPDVLYHASPIDNLDQIGIKPIAPPHLSTGYQNKIFLGSLNYVMNDYLGYAQKRTYYIYSVDVRNVRVRGGLPGEQYSTVETIPPDKVALVKIVDNSKKVIL